MKRTNIFHPDNKEKLDEIIKVNAALDVVNNSNPMIRSQILGLVGDMLDNVGEVSRCSLIHKGCVAFRTKDGRAYKLKIVAQEEIKID